MKKLLLLLFVTFSTITILELKVSAAFIPLSADFSFENTPSHNHAGDHLVSQFGIRVEETLDEATGRVRHQAIFIENNSSGDVTITGVYIQNYADGGQHSGVFLARGDSFRPPPPIPDDILNVLGPDNILTFVADPRFSLLGIPPGSSYSLSKDIADPIIDDFQSGRIRIGILVEGINGHHSDTFVSVPDSGSTALLLGMAALVVGVFARKHRRPQSVG